jgi:dihydroorotase
MYKCGWSPFEGERFGSSVHMTVLNGDIAYREGVVTDEPRGQPLAFRER